MIAPPRRLFPGRPKLSRRDFDRLVTRLLIRNRRGHMTPFTRVHATAAVVGQVRVRTRAVPAKRFR